MAITPNKAAIEAAGLEYIEPTEIVKDTGPKALNLLAQSVVDLMAKGGGSGVREVSGTVTLTTADGPLVQVYATAAATVNGESLMAGDAAVFRLVGGKWEVRVLDVDFEWRVVGTAPVAPPEAIEVTAQAPTWADDTGIGGGAWTTPILTGVTYSPASGTAQPSETVTVTARAQQGFKLTGTTSWSHTFPVDPRKPLETLATASFNTDADGSLVDVYPAIDTGQEWEPAGLYSKISGNRLVADSSGARFKVDGLVREVSAKVYAGATVIYPWIDQTSTEGIYHSPRALVDANGQIGLNGIKVTFKADGNMSRDYTEVGFRPFDESNPATALITYDGTTISLFVNGEKIVAGTPQAADLDSATRSWVAVRFGTIDDLVVKGIAA